MVGGRVRCWATADGGGGGNRRRKQPRQAASSEEEKGCGINHFGNGCLLSFCNLSLAVGLQGRDCWTGGVCGGFSFPFVYYFLVCVLCVHVVVVAVCHLSC